MQGPVEIDDLRPLRDQQRRRDPKRCAGRAADHNPEPSPLRFHRQRECLGQPTHFIRKA